MIVELLVYCLLPDYAIKIGVRRILDLDNCDDASSLRIDAEVWALIIPRHADLTDAWDWMLLIVWEDPGWKFG